MPYVEKRIYSGPMLEIFRYAVSSSGRKLPRRQKEKPSSEAQCNLNEKNAKRKLTRTVNSNFVLGDFFYSMDYTLDSRKTIPIAEGKLEVQNFIRRLKALRHKKKLSPLKYILVTETRHGKPHHHIIFNSDGLTMDEVEALWEKGRVNISKLKPDAFGFEALAKYISKSPTGKKRWSQSKNLKKPTVKPLKIIGKINIYKQPKPPKGYHLIEVETTDSIFTGASQYLAMTKYNLAPITQNKKKSRGG